MCSIEVKDTEIGRIVRLSGELAIDQATELRDVILKAFEGRSELKLDLSMVESADLAGIQVLCAAHRLGVSRGARVTLTAPASQGFLDSLKAIALYPAACDTPHGPSCLWGWEASHE